LIENGAKLGDNGVHLRLISIVLRERFIDRRLPRSIARIGRIIAKVGIFYQEPKDINAKSIHLTIEPKPQDFVHSCADKGVAPIQVGLLRQKAVQIVLAGGLLVGPRRPAELRNPVIWRRAIRQSITPDIPITLFT
jgi:hypothetical protein